MHIGGMRTALFNWLWARHNDGDFILRIDDTDQQRNVDEALGPILRAFRWLGLDWDEGPEVGGENGPYFQSQRGELYADALQRLLAAGAVYRDFDDPQQVRAEREAAEKAKEHYLNPRRSLDLSADEIESFLGEGRPFVYRLRVPRDRTISIDDHVRGHVEWDCAKMNDPAVARGDGRPLYNFATVVDDSALRISHVIRAEEHLSNVPPQCLLYEALDCSPPEFAHIPFVTAPGGKKKLSKRDIDKYRKNPQFRGMFEQGDRILPQIGVEANDSAINPVMVEYYERLGYLQTGVLNALARLGWSLDDKTEFMAVEDLVRHFNLARVVKSSAALDPDKLMSYQSHWMSQLSIEDRANGCLPFLIAADLLPAEPSSAAQGLVTRVVSAADDRIRVFSDILNFAEFFAADDAVEWDEKAFEKRLRRPDDAAALLTSFRDILAGLGSFNAQTTDEALHAFVEERALSIGQIIHALRVAVTGKAKGLGMFDCLEILGQASVLTRIDRAVARI